MHAHLCVCVRTWNSSTRVIEGAPSLFCNAGLVHGSLVVRITAARSIVEVVVVFVVETTQQSGLATSGEVGQPKMATVRTCRAARRNARARQHPRYRHTSQCPRRAPSSTHGCTPRYLTVSGVCSAICGHCFRSATIWRCPYITLGHAA